MKKGDWVEVEGEGYGMITMTGFHPRAHLIWLENGQSKFAVLRSQHLLTKLDPAVGDILTAVNTNERE